MLQKFIGDISEREKNVVEKGFRKNLVKNKLTHLLFELRKYFNRKVHMTLVVFEYTWPPWI